MKKLKFKSDTYRSKRGKSTLLQIQCRKCDQVVALYQKDGPGNLRRMYRDRILYPETSLHTPQQPFLCRYYRAVLGYQIIYKKENRPAVRLFVDAVKKNKTNLRRENDDTNKLSGK